MPGEAPIPPYCVRCRRQDVWRIELRQCQHRLCVACAIVHLKYWIGTQHKARIKCAERSCPVRIHENDIDALLDASNEDLNAYMPCSERELLLYKHRKQSIEYAFGGQTKRCPLCKSMYAEYDGCRYVECVNLRCLQKFCWNCNEPINSYQHFALHGCKVGWLDVWKISYLPRFFIVTEGCILFMIAPIVLPAFAYLSPFVITFLFAYYSTSWIRQKLRQKNWAPYLITLTVALLFPVLMVVAIPLAFGAYIFIFPFSFTYAVMTAFKMIPFVSKIFDAYSLIGTALSCVGLNDWGTLVRESREAKRLEEVKRKQKELEKSERPNGEEDDEDKDLEQGEAAPKFSLTNPMELL
ncbi:unnamed protein product, partial [Anisakis simplex]|uniref:RING-type domain-containing protein n=1 Tax=Anisakis simplex TaxID=6269 RepID=A0A0M3JDD1_ANISI